VQGLTATSDYVAWEQRTAGGASSGLWAYDVRTQRPVQLVGARQVGRATGSLGMSDNVVAWVARAPGDARTPPAVRACDIDSGRLFTAAARGVLPAVSGDTIVWATIADAHGARNGVAGLNTVTDASFTLSAPGRVRQLAACGSWVAWTCGRLTAPAVWAADRRTARRFRLGSAGTGVAVGKTRVVWATTNGRGDTAIVAWTMRTRRVEQVYRVRGEVRALSMAGNLAVWQQADGGGDIWAYDFGRRKALAVCTNADPQACPVLSGRTVFWADRRSGQWELYGRVLQP